MLLALILAGCGAGSSTAPDPTAPLITTQPASQTVTAGQMATFSVVAAGGAPLSYQWKKNGATISGATSASYTTPATVLADNGSQFAVVVSNSVGSVTSNSATLTVTADATATSVLTYHNDNARTGQNLTETSLTPQNVNAASFGKLFSVPVDGAVYAQPLYVANVSIPGQATRNVVFVATEHDSVYAFDADASSPPLWHVSFIDPANGITTLSPADVSTAEVTCQDIRPEIGITGTPVIDPTTGTLYVVARTKEQNGTFVTFVQRLHALDITTGAEKLGGPVLIQATLNGTGAGSVNGKISFDAQRQNQRSALLLQNGPQNRLVYIAWGSLCDVPPYHGWIMAYDSQALSQTGVWNSTPNVSSTLNGMLGGGGIWASGSGPAGDGSSIFFATGNGAFDVSLGDYSGSVIKMGPPTAGVFSVSDYFTPFNQAALNSKDMDLGSGGALLLDQPFGSPQHLLFLCGKEGKLYVIDRDNMGRFNSASDQVIQFIPGANPGAWNSPAWWNNTLYLGGATVQQASIPGTLKAFAFDPVTSMLSTTPSSQTALTFNFPAPTPSISANGNSSGILWMLEESSFEDNSGQAVLRAYDATNLANLLYNSSDNPTRDSPGLSVKFAVPTVVNGKVYVGTRNQLSVFGLLP